MGKLEDMLASGRAPMVLVRGAAWREPVKATAPMEQVLSDRGLAERQEAQTKEIKRRRKVDAELRAASRSSKRKADIQRIASVSVEGYMGMMQRMGGDFFDQSALKQALKDIDQS